MSKKINTVAAAQKSVTELDKACTVALTKYKTIKADANAKAAVLAAAKNEMDKALSAYNDRVLAERYAGFRAGEVNPFIALFTAGEWGKRRYSTQEDAFVDAPARHDVLDFIKSSAAHGVEVCSKANVETKLDLLTASIRDRVTEELAQEKDVHVSIKDIVKALQALMDVIALPSFERGGQKVTVYARPKDARFLCACAVKASRKLGGVEVLSANKIAAYVTDVYNTQIRHAEYTVENAGK